MKCAKCGGQTTWDTSYGKEDYIVCSNCYEKMIQEIKKHNKKTLYPALVALKQIFEQSKM